MKIIFVIEWLSRGGAERVVSVLANEFVKKGHTVGILLYRRAADEYYIDGQVKILEFDNKNALDIKGAVRRKLYRIRSIRKLILNENPDVVIPFVSKIVYETYFALLGSGIPIIGTVRNNILKISKTSLAIQKFTLKRCSLIWLQTIEQMAFLTKNSGKVFCFV